LYTVESESYGLLISNDLNVLISGNNKVFPKNGIYTFTNLTFTASPMYHSTIIISSGALDLAKRKLLEKS
jgi:hypothetical protein